MEAHADDGCLEIFGLKQGWHASMVMVELISAKHIAQVLSRSDKKELAAVRGNEFRCVLITEYVSFRHVICLDVCLGMSFRQ